MLYCTVSLFVRCLQEIRLYVLYIRVRIMVRAPVYVINTVIIVSPLGQLNKGLSSCSCLQPDHSISW